MCGICGWVDWDGNAADSVVRSMMDQLAHRGPDGEGLWRDAEGRAVLGHRRLAILDTTDRAQQPMVDPTGLVMTYNGEVYTFAELRQRLERGGRRFLSTGDTEVVLAALAEWDLAALDELNGMFALALWDGKRGRLVLVRDRLGIKPLFWARLGRGMVFASELPALLAHPGVGRDLDLDGLARWLQLGYNPGSATLLKGVQQLPAGHLLEARETDLELRQWYDPLASTPGRVPATQAEAVEELGSLLTDSVRRRLVSDVPIGCFLSGGVDSTAVVAAGRAAGARPETLTVSFVEGEDESDHAARTASALGLVHRRRSCCAEDMLAAIERWSTMAADPIADPSLAPTALVSRAARERWTVALSGDGGDELLSGYPRLRLMPRLEPWIAMARGARPVLPLLPGRRWAVKLEAALASGSSWEAYQAVQGVWPSAKVAGLLRRHDVPLPWPERVVEQVADLPPWQRYRALDLVTFLPQRMLAKVDRASMACGLEVRVPLLDHRIVELAFAVPVHLAQSKRMLRTVISRLGAPQPPPGKRGFEVPLGAWMRGPLRSAVERALFGNRACELGLEAQLLRECWDQHQSGRADHGERLLAVAVLVWWAEQWLS
jgi:asparagine synthase (glutamine-hydrolysing)